MDSFADCNWVLSEVQIHPLCIGFCFLVVLLKFRPAEVLKVEVFVKRLRDLGLLCLCQRLVNLLKVLRSCNEQSESHRFVSRVHHLDIPCLGSTHLNNIEIYWLYYDCIRVNYFIIDLSGLCKAGSLNLSSNRYGYVREDIRLDGNI